MGFLGANMDSVDLIKIHQHLTKRNKENYMGKF